ncbi:hypothetical protein CLU95_4316 [Variovorax sp. 54]|uniref:hypothetical protein n=1 Tax=Variovorax sp. 54 TaxID=2035212 RepID=UPI000C5983EA|nr:hypothetical protein [Variovorax sp. 54]PIF77144.1 hypothetical protein CLU95_4316 [Variovorax sp. 54]
MTKRDWASWPGRLGKKIESTSGRVAIVSGMAAAAGLVLATPTVLAVGGVVTVGALIAALVQSFPEKKRSISEFIGGQCSLEDLDSLDLKIPRLAVVGVTQSGKSTFLSTAQQINHVHRRTNKIYAEIMTLPGAPAKYVALLDGDGEKYMQQFEIAAKADYLVVFVDHNISSSSGDCIASRLREHEQFKDQMEPVLRQRGTIERIYLLMNKRDIWEAGSDAAMASSWFDAFAKDYSKSGLSKTFAYSNHSNKNTTDTAAVMQDIRDFVSKWKVIS